MSRGAVGRPCGRLRPYVDSYVGYRLEGFPAGVHRGLPSEHLTLILSLDAPVDMISMPDPAQAPLALDALVGGLHSSPVLITHDGNQHGVHLEVTPLGASALLGMPAGELASAVVDLRTLLGSRADEAHERIAAADTWTERFAVLDDVLGRAVDDRAAMAPEVGWGWHRIVESGGAIEIGALAAEVGWSRRHFGERFRTELGLAPKVAARVVRFGRAKQLLARADRPGLATVAAACGYFDQAHLTRDWGEFAGCTPTAWIADELPSVQDDDLVDVA